MFVINLKTRKQQKCSFHAAGDTSQADTSKNGKDEIDLAPEIPLWNPRRVQVAAEQSEFYVSNRVDPAAAPFRQLSRPPFHEIRVQSASHQPPGTARYAGGFAIMVCFWHRRISQDCNSGAR